MAQIEIQPLTAASVPAAAAFYSARMDDTFSQTFPPAAIVKYRENFNLERLTAYVTAGDRELLAARVDEQIAGIMFGSPLNGGVASVVWMAVSPQFRGHGIGRQLMEETFRRYRQRGAHKVVLYTETDSGKAFYEAVGMTLEGTHPQHWWGLKHYCLGRILESSAGA
ncbi:MAG: hypothetical protein PCFJNLEI_01844 [Verrucomicrobiae bacterium]|nr:hypothetical protein [Verrucomicrobiae bacterium]